MHDAILIFLAVSGWGVALFVGRLVDDAWKREGVLRGAKVHYSECVPYEIIWNGERFSHDGPA